MTRPMQLRDLQRQYEALKPAMDAALLSTAASGHYILGNAVEQIEERLARYVGVRHCVTCASGTDALTLSLMTLGIGQGDAVFVPDFTFFATAEAVALRGAVPIFVDVCEASFNMDAADLRRKIVRVEQAGQLQPRAVIAVDLFGLPADYAALRQETHRHGMVLIEDAAQGFGGMAGSQRACSFGDMAATSFFPSKPLGCYGDGGAVFTDNDEWAATLLSLRVHGKGEDKYHNIRLGLNSRLDAMQAAVLQVKMDALEGGELQRVEAIAQQYTDGLHDVAGCPLLPAGLRSSWAQYTLRLSNARQRDGLQACLSARHIPSAVYYALPMHLQPIFLPTSSSAAETCPHATLLSHTVLSLPMHPYLTAQETAQVIAAVREALADSPACKPMP